MSSILQKLKKLLPADQTQQSNRKRTLIWERWDTNLFGFLSITEILSELSQLLQIAQDDNISLIVKRAFKSLINSIGGQNSLQGQYLEQRHFRLFLENLCKLIEKMLIFQLFDSDHDNTINLDEQVQGQKILEMLKLDDQKHLRIYQMSTNNQLTFQQFISWVSELENTDINDLN